MATIPLIYFEQYTKNREYQIFRISQSQRTIEINDKQVDMEVLKEFVTEEDLNKFFAIIRSIKSERMTFSTESEYLDIVITKTFSTEDSAELRVKADYNDGNSGYSPNIIESLKKAIIEVWNDLFKDCLTVSEYEDYCILKPVSKLCCSRRPNNYSMKNFHNFTMSILRESEPTPLEEAYKEFIRRIFEMSGFSDDTLIFFDGITTRANECYLSLTSYSRFSGIQTMVPAYRPSINKFGKFIKPRFREGPLTIASIKEDSGMTTAKEITDILFENSH